MKVVLVTAFILVSACATNTGVTPIGNDTFKIYKRAGAFPTSGSSELKAEAMNQATLYCVNQKKSVHVVKEVLGSPPYILGNFPKAELHFKCIDTTEVEPVRLASPNEQSRLGASARNKDDMYEELKKLKSLLDDGTLTREEFDTKKSEILAK